MNPLISQMVILVLENEEIPVVFRYDINQDQWRICHAETGAVIAYCVLGTIPVVNGRTVDDFGSPMHAQRLPDVQDQ